MYEARTLLCMPEYSTTPDELASVMKNAGYLVLGKGTLAVCVQDPFHKDRVLRLSFRDNTEYIDTGPEYYRWVVKRKFYSPCLPTVWYIAEKGNRCIVSLQKYRELTTPEQIRAREIFLHEVKPCSEAELHLRKFGTYMRRCKVSTEDVLLDNIMGTNLGTYKIIDAFGAIPSGRIYGFK